MMRNYDPKGQPSTLPCHQYQRDVVRECFKLVAIDNIEDYPYPVLNIACKEDPAFLGRDFGALNVDQQDFDPQEGMNLYDLPNFEQGSALDLRWDNETFPIVVIGELLEHCPVEAAHRVLSEARRVMIEHGMLVVTFPLDPRPAEQQHAPEHLVEWEGGITSWHQSVWTDDEFQPLILSAHLKEIESMRRTLHYGFCDGVGCVLMKTLGV